MSLIGSMLFSLAVATATPLPAAPSEGAPENPRIDMPGFLEDARAAAAHRQARRVDEAEFRRMMAEPGTVVLDARSPARYAELHVDGAVNLAFTDFTAEALAGAIPSKDTRILIYCNNNFRGEERAFPAKIAPASLNLSTFVALYQYGYRNVYELGPATDIAQTTLPLAGPLAPSATASADAP